MKMARLQWTLAWSVGLLIVAPTLLLLLMVQLPYSTTIAQRLQMLSSSTSVDSQLTSLSLGASPLLPYNCYSIPFKSVPALLLHPCLFLPPQEPKLLACASLAIFSYCPSGLKGSFTTSSLYLATIRIYCPSGLKGSFILPLLYVMPSSLSSNFPILKDFESIS